MIWLAVSLVGFALGSVIGYLLLWLLFFTTLFMGYSDSGPPWINTMNDILIYAGGLVGIAGSQILYFKRIREGKTA